MGSFPHVPWLEQVKLGIRDLSYLLQQVWKHQVWGRTDWTSTRQCTSCGWDCFWPFWDEPEPFNLNHTKHWGGVCFFLLFTGSPFFAAISKKILPFSFPFSSFLLLLFCSYFLLFHHLLLFHWCCSLFFIIFLPLLLLLFFNYYFSLLFVL